MVGAVGDCEGSGAEEELDISICVDTTRDDEEGIINTVEFIGSSIIVEVKTSSKVVVEGIETETVVAENTMVVATETEVEELAGSGVADVDADSGIPSCMLLDACVIDTCSILGSKEGVGTIATLSEVGETCAVPTNVLTDVEEVGATSRELEVDIMGTCILLANVEEEGTTSMLVESDETCVLVVTNEEVGVATT